jgi:hypothetical protein
MTGVAYIIITLTFSNYIDWKYLINNFNFKLIYVYLHLLNNEGRNSDHIFSND